MGGVESNMMVATMDMVTDVEKEHCLIMRSHFQKNIAEDMCDLDNHHEIKRDTLNEAVLLLPPSDRLEIDIKIMENLFVMHDRNFSDSVDYKELLVSFTYMITGDAKSKFMYAFSIYDEDEKGSITSGDLRKILRSLNLTAMYFGDPGLTELNIKEIVHDMYLNCKVKTAPKDYTEIVEDIVEHTTVKKFLGGWGNTKFGDCSQTS